MSRPIVPPHLRPELAAVALMGAAGLLVQVLLLPRLPDRIAIGWDAAGAPSGTASPMLCVLTSLLLLVVLLLCGALLRPPGRTARFLGGCLLAASTFGAAFGTGLLVVQLDLPHASAVPAPWGLLLLCSALLLPAGALGWLLARPGPEPAFASRHPAALPVARGERIAWVGGVGMRPALLVILGLAGVLAASCFALAAMLGALPAPLGLSLGAACALLVAVCLCLSVFRVRIDRGGVLVRSALGVPRWRIPLDEVDSVAVAEVQPLRDYGGWGLRQAAGRVAIVLRAGEALEIGRRGRRPLVVSLRDADGAAAVLRALLERERSEG